MRGRVRYNPLLLATAAILLAAGPLLAQVSPSLYDYPRRDLDWYTIETEHFRVHFHADPDGRGSSRTAQVTARIAEEVYEPITSLYDYRPRGKVSIILKDFEDYSNGAAYFFDNMIEIWAPSLDSPLRGDHNWLRNVITHEFTHMVQLQKAMKGSRRFPMRYFQWLSYEDVKRPDVLYGYPDVIVSYPFPIINTPAWLAEGTAQFQREGLHYDSWDAHRDMLLRTQILEGRELSLKQMGGFYSHTSLQRESVYNHGYALTRFIADTYGEESLRELSAGLAKWRNWNVERAMRDALGVPAREVYEGWIAELRRHYEAETAGIRENTIAGEPIQISGFSNFYPKFSPDGKRLAYISNRGQDFNLLSLYVKDFESGETTAHRIEGLEREFFAYHCTLDDRLRPGVAGTFDWHPDGNRIVFARISDTRAGHRYSDLYLYDLESRNEERITHNRRAANPAYSPDGSVLAFVVQEDGSTNLHVLNAASGEIERLTNFRDGTQVTDPVWTPDGGELYFTIGQNRGRSLYRISISRKSPEPVLEVEHEIHSPAISGDGAYLYFASDASGIFNIYRAPAADPGEWEQVTNVVGGAFMPHLHGGRMVFAHYQADGYKLHMMEDVKTLPPTEVAFAYAVPRFLQDAPGNPSGNWPELNHFDDSDVRALSPEEMATLRSGETITVDIYRHEAPPPSIRSYRDDFTPFMFIPVVRLDEYVTSRRIDAQIARRSPAQRMLRNTKIGTYAASREVLGGLSFFGGLMVSPASGSAGSWSDYFAPDNLLGLERDAFVIFEYNKGLPFIRERWSPQLAFELYNVRRNVENGLSIEEFPCTACYPDTTFADIAYSLYEMNFMARSKVSRNLLLEAGYRYSPYQVRVERFFSREHRQNIPGSTTRYFIGRALTARAYFEAFRPHRHANVVPEGMRVELGYEYQPSRLLDRFDVEDGMLVPRYDEFSNHRLSIETRLYRTLPGSIGGAPHGLGLRLKASTILGPPVPDFFNDYVGGLIGARGYPFYALGGNETVWAQLSYHFPLLPSINRQFLFLYADKLYGRVYADAAAAWSGAWPGADVIRKDVGAELRLGVGSFYLFPTALFVSATYGFDRFDLQLDEGFVTPDGRNFVTYGRELLWHFGVLFSFDL